jgi:hypothetical protein
LENFKEIEKNPFTLSHRWVKIKDYSKWQESFAAWYKEGSNKHPRSMIDLEEDGQARNGQEDTKQARPICGDKLYPLQ